MVSVSDGHHKKSSQLHSNEAGSLNGKQLHSHGPCKVTRFLCSSWEHG